MSPEKSHGSDEKLLNTSCLYFHELIVKRFTQKYFRFQNLLKVDINLIFLQTFSGRFQRRSDTRHNDIQHNDIKHIDIQHNDTQHNDTQHKGIIRDTQHK